MRHRYFRFSCALAISIYAHLSVEVSAAVCTIKIGGRSASDLTSVGGATDAPQFREYGVARDVDNGLYILDPLADRVLFFDANCIFRKSYALDAADSISGITLIGNHLFGISASGDVKRLLERQGQSLPSLSRLGPGEQTSNLDSDSERAQAVLQNFAMPLADRRGTFDVAKLKVPGEIALVPSENRKFMTDGMPIQGQDGIWYRYTFESLTDKSGRLTLRKFDLSETVSVIAIKAKDNLGSVEVAGVLPDGRFAVAAETFSVTARGILRVVVELLLIDANHGLLQAGRFAFPVPSDKKHGRPTAAPIFIKPGIANAVFIIPLVTAKGLIFREISLDENSKDNTISIGSSDSEESGIPWQHPDLSTVDFYRQAILARAEAYLTMKWVVLEKSLKPRGDPRCVAEPMGWRLPYFLRTAQAQSTIYGAPYSWGSKESAAIISERLKKGALAGNVCCLSYTDPKSGKTLATSRSDATGIDCSGLVSRAWDLKDKNGKNIGAGTSNLAEFSTVVSDPKKLLPGDAISRKGDHVRLFSAWITKPLGLRIRAYESTTDSLCSGVCERDLPIRLYHDYSLLGARSSVK